MAGTKQILIQRGLPELSFGATLNQATEVFGVPAAVESVYPDWSVVGWNCDRYLSAEFYRMGSVYRLTALETTSSEYVLDDFYPCDDVFCGIKPHLAERAVHVLRKGPIDEITSSY